MGFQAVKYIVVRYIEGSKNGPVWTLGRTAPSTFTCVLVPILSFKLSYFSMNNLVKRK